MKSRLSYDAFIALVNAETVEQFLVEKDMLGLAGQFNQQDSFELVTVLVVRHCSSLADELGINVDDCHGLERECRIIWQLYCRMERSEVQLYKDIRPLQSLQRPQRS